MFLFQSVLQIYLFSTKLREGRGNREGGKEGEKERGRRRGGGRKEGEVREDSNLDCDVPFPLVDAKELY